MKIHYPSNRTGQNIGEILFGKNWPESDVTQIPILFKNDGMG
jgi:hypothetical protein